MHSEWACITWGALATLEYGKALRGYAKGIGVYRVFGTNGPIGWYSLPLCNRDGVIIGRKGAYRGVHYSPTPFSVIDTAFYLKPKVDFNMQWAYYELLTHDINAMDSGSAIPSTSREEFYRLPVLVPPRKEQDRIVEVLAALDRRIELLRRTNETLEAIGRAIFKSWFVNFDPVKAKAEGRDPEGMDAATAALFPSEFQDSELGPIPKGWTVENLSDAIMINPSRSLKKGSAAPYLDMANAPVAGHRPSGWLIRTFGSGTKFMNGDTLLARITPCLENGKTAFVDFLQPEQIGWGSTEFVVLGTRGNIPPEFIYLLARWEPFRSFAIQSMSGTSGRQRVQTDRLGQYKLALPGKQVLERFGALIEPLFARIKSASEQSQTLAEVRDSLLPKLISGQLRIPEAANCLSKVLA